MGDLKNYIKGVSSGYLNMLVINIVGLLLTPFILKYVTREEFALFYIASDLLMWLGLAQLGVASSYTSLAAKTFGANDHIELSLLSSSAWGLQIISALIILLLGFGLSFFLSSFFDINDSIKNVQLFFLIMVMTSTFTVLKQVYVALMTAAKEIHISNRISIISLVPKVAFTILFLILGWKLVGLAFANLLAVIVPILISIYYVKRKYKNIQISLRLWTKEHSKKLLVSGLWFSLGGIAGILILGLDRIVIAKVVSLEIVASFLITQKLFFLSEKILSQIINVSRPFFGHLFGNNSISKMYSLYIFFTKLSIFTAAIVASIIILINEYFIAIWVGSDLFAGNNVTLWLAINFVIQFILLPNRVLLATTLHRLKWQNSLRVLEGLVNLGISIILGKALGIPGVILGSIISSILFSNIFFNYYCDEFFRINHIKSQSKIYFHYLFLLLILFTYLIINISPDFYLRIVAMAVIFVASLLYLKRIIFQTRNDGLIKPGQLPSYIEPVIIKLTQKWLK